MNVINQLYPKVT